MDLDKSTSTTASMKKLQDDGLDSDTVGRRVGQVMISAPSEASDIPIPLCERGPAERTAAINALPLTDVIGPLVDHQAAASLKEGVAKEASDVAAAAAATTSGSNIPKKGSKFSSVLGTHRKAPNPALYEREENLRRTARAKATQGGTDAASSASPAATSTDVVVATKDREAAPSNPIISLMPTRGPSTDDLTWGELQVEMEHILQAGARGVGREIEEARVVASSANQRADQLARDLAEARENLLKMRELVVGNERQRQGLEHRMSELENNLSRIRGSLRISHTGLHQLAGECGVTTTIPANPDEFSLTSSLAELATAMEEITSKHAARIGEETSNRIYTGACHVLACVRLAHPDLDLKKALDQGAADDARKGVVEEVDDLGESVLPLFEEDIDIEDVQQRGQPNMPVVVPALALEPFVPREEADFENTMADRVCRIQYWRTKLEMAKLENTMIEVKKDQAVETLRGREVWFNSYLKSCCTAMARVCKELRVPRRDLEESAAGYISWLNGACAQLEGIGKRIDEALKQECRRSSQYTRGHVLACIRDHRPQQHLEFLHEGFSRSRRTPTEIDGLEQSMAPLTEKVFRSVDWRWPSW
uniref:Myosin heavy chain-like protein n=2 Tax=Oryza sativa subsp. japonica TaxID=39947 RepID=Q2R6D5_ORYSJ|nr:hypothetical protein LOC_Os11g20430 [Oryza sativa Japonica Group]ABA92887.1 hypothetical protein LOC_Os11g20430 [Oryza sativa Japonica Group]